MADAALSELTRSIQAGELVDLHTHLMGLGDATFWIDRVMKEVLPICTRTRFFEYYDPSVTQGTFPGPPMNFPANEMHSAQLHGEEGKAYVTAEVIYSLETLCKCFIPKRFLNEEGGRIINVTVRQELLSQLEVALGRPVIIGQGSNAIKFPDLCKTYAVWNARNQQQELRFGISNTDLLRLMESNRSLKTRLQTCFVMDAVDGGAASAADKETRYRQNFTPEFYPRRYAMKDDMYSQYPAVLDTLLEHSLLRYARSGVRYVEFSVGVGDVMRPGIWRHLAKPVLLNDEAKSVEFRFLAGFSREALGRQNGSTWEPLCLALDKPVEMYRKAVAETLDPRGFSKLIAQLAELRKALKASRTQNAEHGIHRLVVGLDYFSDEYRRPYCPFGEPDFIDFLQEERRQRDGCFGFRYHCGECDQTTSESPYLLAHVGASCKVIINVLNAIADHQPPPLRIGHGLALRHFTYLLNYRDGSSVEQSLVSKTPPYLVLTSWITTALQMMWSHKTPIEVNLTSNDYLESDHNPALRSFLSNNLPVVLCTDNDGIWPCQHGAFSSVAAEFYAAITGTVGLISRGLDADEVKLLVRNGLRSRFTKSQPVSAVPIPPSIAPILPRGVFFVQGNQLPHPCPVQLDLRRVFAAVGRLTRSAGPGYAGTAWCLPPCGNHRVAVTTRSVAKIFYQDAPDYPEVPSDKHDLAHPMIDLNREANRHEPLLRISVDRCLWMGSGENDLALLSIKQKHGNAALPAGIPLASSALSNATPRQLGIIGHPDWNDSSDAVQKQFLAAGGVRGGKCLHTGQVVSLGRHLAHNAVTARNSGSVVVDLSTARVVAVGVHVTDSYGNHAGLAIQVDSIRSALRFVFPTEFSSFQLDQ